jgi:16S rRNA (uracil1498-N3)-methyltransferase
MHRFHLPPKEISGSPLTLAGREAHHALRVLRLRRGDRVAILDGAGTEYLADIRDFDRDKLQLEIAEKRLTPRPSCPITLLQAVPKGKLIESIIQKATELGVARIVPLLAERVTTHLNGADAARKAEKLQQVAIEAIKQCGATWLPKVEPPISLLAFLARKETFELPLIASLQPGSRHAREYFDGFHQTHGRLPRSICIWVGPEGDFTPDEVAAVIAAGAQPITLGPLVLRVETAAVYCLSILNYELQAAATA